MENLQATGTLSVAVDTSSADASLTRLETRLTKLGSQGSVAAIAADAPETLRKMQMLEAEVQVLTDRLQKNGQARESMSRVTRSWSAAEGAARLSMRESTSVTTDQIKAMATAERAAKELARAKNQVNNLELKLIAAEEAGKIKAAERAAKDLARAKDQANKLELRVIAAEEARKTAETTRAVRDLARAKDQANKLELRVIAAEEAGKVKAAEKAARELARVKDQANRLELRVIAAEEAKKAAEAARTVKELARAKDQANRLELRVIAAEEAKKVADAARAVRELARARDQVNRLELKVIAAEEAGRIKAAEKAARDLARAKDQANRLELKVIAAEEAKKAQDAARTVRELARAKNQANNLELKVIRDEELAKIRAATKAANELKAATSRSISYQAATPVQRASTNLKAGIALAAGADTSGYAAEAVAAARAAGSVDALRAAKEKLTGGSHALVQATSAVTGGMQELHTGARGVAGAFGQLWMTYGSLVPLLTGAAIGAAFKSTLSRGADFEYQLTFVKALGGESAEAVERLSAAARDLGSNGLYGPLKVAEGMRILAQAGLNAREQLAAIPQVLDLATVGELDVESAAETLVGVATAFGKSKLELQSVGDVIAKAAAVSQTSVSAMTESMKYASVVGEQYNVSLEDTSTALAVLAQLNITGTSAGTAFRNMVKELYTPTNEAAKAFKLLGLETKNTDGTLRNMVDIVYDLRGKLEPYDKASQTNILQKMFGERGAKEAIAMLAKTREEWDALRNSVADSNGFMGQVAAELEATTSGTLKQAFNTLESSLIEVFNTSKYGMGSLATELKELFGSEEFKKTVADFAQLVTSAARAVIEYKEVILAVVAGAVIGKLALAVDSLAIAFRGVTVAAAGAAGATGLAGLAGVGTKVLAVLAPLAGPAGVVAAVAAGLLLLWQNMENGESSAQVFRQSLDSVNNVLDRQLEKLLAGNRALEERYRLAKGMPSLDQKEAKDFVEEKERQYREEKQKLADKEDKYRTGGLFSGVSYWEIKADRKALDESRKILEEERQKYNRLQLAAEDQREKELVTRQAEAEKKTRDKAAALVDQLKQSKRSGADTWAKALEENPGEDSVKGASDFLEKGKKSLSDDVWSTKKKGDSAKGDRQRYDDERILKQLSGEKGKLGEMLAGGETLSAAQRMMAEIEANIKDKSVKFKDDGTLAMVRKSMDELKALDEQWRSKSRAKEDTTNRVDRLQNQLAEEQDVVKRHEAALEREYSVGAIVAQEYYTRLAAMRAKAYEDQVIVFDKEIEALKAYQEEWTKPGTVEFKEYDRKIEDVKSKRRRLDINRGAEEDQIKFETWRATDLSPMRGIVDAMREIRDSAMDLASTFKEGLKGALDIAANGFVNLATTGKMSVRGMVSDMLTYLAKLAANKAFMMIASMAMSAVMPSTYNGWDGAQGSGGMYQANGGAWNQGVQAFAKGGAFTNTVVDTPTMFKFAKGTGLMGEAGPEAIMPLTRDASGRLGVTNVGGGGGGMVVNQTVTVVVESKDGGGREQGNDIAASLAPQLKAMMMAVIVDQKRPGGLLV